MATRFLICASDVTPCPAEAQQWSTAAEILTPADLGITPEEVLKVVSWGFGFVLAAFVLGYVVALATGLIRKA